MSIFVAVAVAVAVNDDDASSSSSPCAPRDDGGSGSGVFVVVSRGPPERNVSLKETLLLRLLSIAVVLKNLSFRIKAEEVEEDVSILVFAAD